MAYVGGKSKNSEHILEILNLPEFDNMDYLEPFVGYAHILRRVENKNSYTASDSNPLLVSLLKGIQEHKHIPRITKKRYYELKEMKNNNSFERAVACFTMSYNGKAWGGYVRDNRKSPSFKKYGKLMDYRKQRINYYKKLQDPQGSFMKTNISCKSYMQQKPKNKLIYCDPPYQDTTGYNTGDVFDHKLFWETMRKWSKDNIVFISEYNAPKDFIEVSRSEKFSTLAGKSNRGPPRMEKLFIYKYT